VKAGFDDPGLEIVADRLPGDMISESAGDFAGMHEGSTRSREVMSGRGAVRDLVEA
jgi:hypothetical protein